MIEVIICGHSLYYADGVLYTTPKKTSVIPLDWLTPKEIKALEYQVKQQKVTKKYKKARRINKGLKTTTAKSLPAEVKKRKEPVPVIQKPTYEKKTKVGVLKTTIGIGGLEPALPGHTVYRKDDRYILWLTDPTKPEPFSHQVSFYLSTLEPAIEFDKT